MSSIVPKYSRSQYYDYAKEKFDAIDWSQVASDAAEVAGNVGSALYDIAAATATTTASVTLSAARVARSAIALEGPEPLATLAAMTDKSCFPTFIDKNTFEKRKLLFQDLQEKHPDKIPIVVEKAPGSRFDIDSSFLSKRYLVPFRVTLGSFMQSVRTTLKIPTYESIWLTTTFGKCILGSLSTPMIEFYNRHRSIDGFLYLQIREQNAFG
jgi:GABA(A) receptor-associated protein